MGDLVLQQIAAWGVSMRGSIRSRQWCPVCGARGKYRLRDFGQGRRALVCQCGQFIANKLFIQIKWQGKLYDIRRDENGRPLSDYPHAERALGTINNQIENTLDPSRRGTTFNPKFWVGPNTNSLLWENYLAEYLKREEKRCSAASFARKRALARHLAWFNGRLIREIKAGDLEDFASLPCLQLALAPKTRLDLIRLLGHIFKQAELREDIKKAPALPKVVVPKKPIKWMNQDQQARVMEYIPAPHRPIFMFLMQYGCRVGEACALCWDCVDLDNMAFVLARTFSRRRLSDTTKTRRHNPLPIVGWFEDYLTSRPQGINQTPVFQNPEADPRRNPSRFYLPDFLRAVWREALEKAGFEPIQLKNATRHSAGTQKRLQGWDEGLIARLLGHASTKYVRGTYMADDLSLLRKELQGGVHFLSEDQSDQPGGR